MARKRPRTHKPDEANPAFIMTRLVMLDSVAYWALKPIERTILSVIEIEHMRHGGVENGRLIVTRRQFEKRGIPLKAIAPGLRALEALGFIEITERGAAGVGDHVQAHHFRLTYVQPNPTDEWRKHHDPGMSGAVAVTARKSADIRARKLGLRGAEKQIAGSKTDTGKVSKWTPGPWSADPQKAAIGVQMDTGTGSRLDTTIYISGDRGAAPDTALGDAATRDDASLTLPSRFRCRRAVALSFGRWGQVKAELVAAKRPRRAGGLSQARCYSAAGAATTLNSRSSSRRPHPIVGCPRMPSTPAPRG
jgi:hypothetical protein